MFTAPKLRERLVETVDQGRYQIIVNLQGVSFMDSTGLGTLVGGLKRVKEHEGTLALVCSSRPVLRVLSITGLNNVFPIHETVEQAVASHDDHEHRVGVLVGVQQYKPAQVPAPRAALRIGSFASDGQTGSYQSKSTSKIAASQHDASWFRIIPHDNRSLRSRLRKSSAHTEP